MGLFLQSHLISCTCPDTCLLMTNDPSLSGSASLWTLLVQHEWQLSSASQHRPLHPAPLSGSQLRLSTPQYSGSSRRQRKLGATTNTLYQQSLWAIWRFLSYTCLKSFNHKEISPTHPPPNFSWAEGDSKGDFRGDFKQDLEGDLLTRWGQVI